MEARRRHIITVKLGSAGAHIDASRRAGEYGRHIAARIREAAASSVATLLEYSCREGAFVEFHDEGGNLVAEPHPVRVLGMTIEKTGRNGRLQLRAVLDSEGNDVPIPHFPGSDEPLELSEKAA